MYESTQRAEAVHDFVMHDYDGSNTLSEQEFAALVRRKEKHAKPTDEEIHARYDEIHVRYDEMHTRCELYSQHAHSRLRFHASPSAHHSLHAYHALAPCLSRFTFISRCLPSRDL